MNLDTEQIDVIDEQLIAGNIIAAIREYRRLTGSELGDAKRYTGDRLKQLQKENSLEVSKTSPTQGLSPEMLRQIKPLPESDLHGFRSTLNQIEKVLYGSNYAVSLSVCGAMLPATSELPINELMSVFYPSSTPQNAKISRVSSEELTADVTQCLTCEGSYSAEALMPEYWRQLNALVPLDSSSIYSYDSDVGLPGDYVFWFFAYLIHNPNANRCVVITGMSSD